MSLSEEKLSYFMSEHGETDFEAMSLITTKYQNDKEFWDAWSVFIEEYVNKGLLVRGLDPYFYIIKVGELMQAVFSP
jgi:hypothetical protein